MLTTKCWFVERGTLQDGWTKAHVKEWGRQWCWPLNKGEDWRHSVSKGDIWASEQYPSEAWCRIRGLPHEPKGWGNVFFLNLDHLKSVVTIDEVARGPVPHPPSSLQGFFFDTLEQAKNRLSVIHGSLVHGELLFMSDAPDVFILYEREAERFYRIQKAEEDWGIPLSPILGVLPNDKVDLILNALEDKLEVDKT